MNLDAFDLMTIAFIATLVVLYIVSRDTPQIQEREHVAKKTIKCDRCNRRLRRSDMLHWNQHFEHGLIVENICPTCQTLPEHLEGKLNLAKPITYMDGKHYEILSMYKTP